MALTNLQKVRSLIGDLDKAATNENVASKADGATSRFQLDMFPVRTGTLEVLLSAVEITGITDNFPIVTIDFTGSTSTTPTAGSQILASYHYNALSDDEIQNTLDLASGGGTIMAGALGARAIAGNNAKLFAYAQGSKKVDKDKLSSKMMKLAESLEKGYEKNLSLGPVNLTVPTFDDSGSAYDGYDTAVALDTTEEDC